MNDKIAKKTVLDYLIVTCICLWAITSKWGRGERIKGNKREQTSIVEQLDTANIFNQLVMLIHI